MTWHVAFENKLPFSIVIFLEVLVNLSSKTLSHFDRSSAKYVDFSICILPNL
jgi:hypothetical protein